MLKYAFSHKKKEKKHTTVNLFVAIEINLTPCWPPDQTKQTKNLKTNN